MTNYVALHYKDGVRFYQFLTDVEPFDAEGNFTDAFWEMVNRISREKLGQSLEELQGRLWVDDLTETDVIHG